MHRNSVFNSNAETNSSQLKKLDNSKDIEYIEQSKLYMTPSVPSKVKNSQFYDERFSGQKYKKVLGAPHSPRVNDFFIIDTN